MSKINELFKTQSEQQGERAEVGTLPGDEAPLTVATAPEEEEGAGQPNTPEGDAERPTPAADAGQHHGEPITAAENGATPPTPAAEPTPAAPVPPAAPAAPTPAELVASAARISRPRVAVPSTSPFQARPKDRTPRAKLFIFGDLGTGKTKFALQFPALAYIDTEHGTDMFQERKRDPHVGAGERGVLCDADHK